MKKNSYFSLIFVFIFLVTPAAFGWLPLSEEGRQNEKPEAIEGVGIEEKLNDTLPLQTMLINEQGNTVPLGSFFNGEKPVILSMVYYSCPSLCNLHLKGVFEVFKELKLVPGKDFEFVAVTIDPKESPDLAQSKKEVYAETYGASEHISGLHFLTGKENEIKRLANAVGFKYKWVEAQKEWAHASAAIVSTPNGKISRYLHGVYFEPKTFRLSVVEASEGKVGSIVEHFALMCFRWDPNTNGYALNGFYVMRWTAGLLVLLMLLWLTPVWWRSRKMEVKSNNKV